MPVCDKSRSSPLRARHSVETIRHRRISTYFFVGAHGMRPHSRPIPFVGGSQRQMSTSAPKLTAPPAFSTPLYGKSHKIKKKSLVIYGVCHIFVYAGGHARR
jgi:hypothetical protein